LFFSAPVPRPLAFTLFPYTTLFRSQDALGALVIALALGWTLQAFRAWIGVVRNQVGLDRLILFKKWIHIDDQVFDDGKTEHRLRSEEHTSELQSPYDLVCRLLLEKK